MEHFADAGAGRGRSEAQELAAEGCGGREQGDCGRGRLELHLVTQGRGGQRVGVEDVTVTEVVVEKFVGSNHPVLRRPELLVNEDFVRGGVDCAAHACAKRTVGAARLHEAQVPLEPDVVKGFGTRKTHPLVDVHHVDDGACDGVPGSETLDVGDDPADVLLVHALYVPPSLAGVWREGPWRSSGLLGRHLAMRPMYSSACCRSSGSNSVK